MRIFSKVMSLLLIFFVATVLVSCGLGNKIADNRIVVEISENSVNRLDIRYKTGKIYDGGLADEVDSIELTEDGLMIKPIKGEARNLGYLIGFSEGAKKNIMIRLSATHIQWKNKKDSEWNNLIDLTLMRIEKARDGKSAYELYIEKYPDYTKSEEDWMVDMVSGKLIKEEQDKFEIKNETGTKTFYAAMLWANRDPQKTSNLQLVDDNIMVINPSKSANYESLVIESNTFVELVLTWNVRDLSSAVINFKVAIGKNDQFSKDFLMGIWKKDSPASSINDSDTYASLSHDILSNKNITNNLIKLKFSVITNNDEAFKINNISVTTKKDYNQLFVDESVLTNVELDVPQINQLSIPTIGSVICSPTSVTMVLNYYGYNYDAPTTAAKVRDTRSGIYGNWTFNASTAGAHNDLYARVEYIKDYAVAHDYLKRGIPVVLSVNTQTKEELPGSLSGYPAGHLIVLIGMEFKDGIWYGVINDPAFYNDHDVRKLYPLDLLMKAHRGYSYIITNEKLD